ncbi:MAG: glycosyltransferase family 4 protein, partial [Propionibacterium sp.]|nr:glycosyltransferase family 4 protein [Propionibacterium sp.]
MVVNNGIANDARVIKTAAALRRAGAEVTVLGIATAGGPREETTAGGVRYVRLPVFPRRGATAAYLRFALARRAAHLVRDPRRWQRTLPSLRWYQRAFTRELRALDPDIVHAHDIHLLDTVARTWPPHRCPFVIYDAHEYVADLAVAGRRTRREVESWAAKERDRISDADAVITVSPEIATRLAAEHHLPRRPTVVLNAPVRFDGPADPGAPAGPVRSLRAEVGVSASTPLAVYGGALSTARGLGTVIEALPLVPDLHLAIVAVPYPHPMSQELRELATSLGVADRTHLIEPVAAHEVPAFLASADIGVSAILGTAASYDMAMPNKLFEFLHAGLRIVTS